MDERQAAKIGAQVRQARKRHPYTVRELAAAAGVAPNTVTRIEKGGTVRPGNLRAVLDALGIDPLADQAGVSDTAEDIALAQSVIGQWMRYRDAESRRRFLHDLMRLVAGNDQ